MIRYCKYLMKAKPQSFISSFRFHSSAFKDGQAMIEFVIALVCIVVVFAGLLQIGILGVTRTEVLIEARRKAGAAVMQDIILAPLPEFIEDWAPGGDLRTYSADDLVIPGNPSDFSVRVVSRAYPVELNTLLPNNPASTMANTPAPQIGFGFTSGDATETVPLIPAVRNLLYRSDEILLHEEVWLPWTKGIY